MTRPEPDASFRDPGGRLVVRGDEVVRWVRAAGRPDMQAFLDSATIQDAMRQQQVVATRRLPPTEADAELRRWADPPVPRPAALLRHDKIPFPSHPYEWAPEMLAQAAALTLDLHERLLDEGLGLKDATPDNLLFRGPRPVFVDALSVERRDPHDPVWLPHGQFVRTFLLPLLLARDQGVPLTDSLLTRRDGLDPAAVHRRTPRLRRLREPYRSLVTLPTWLGARAEKRPEQVHKPRRLNNPEQARYVLHAAVRRLRRHLRRAAPPTGTSSWSRYMRTRPHYPEATARRKDAFVQAALATHRPAWVLDIGCNTGHYSAMAAGAGAHVVAIDSDPACVGRTWRRAQADDLDVLPLVVDIARPTPATGWRNREHASFLERAEGRFDLVLLLAVMHHLHVTERIPLEEIVALVARLARPHAVIEYVGPDDPMFRRLLRGRDALHAGEDRDGFEAILARHFRILETHGLEGMDRVLYRLERRTAPTDEAAGQEQPTRLAPLPAT